MRIFPLPFVCLVQTVFSAPFGEQISDVGIRHSFLDRDGRPLAQTKMAYHIALDFTAYNGPIDPKVAATWAQTKIAQANALVDGNEAYSDSKLANYYKNR
ncbi:hypothetical protein N9187_02960, partial [Akkermansiaceae bacterium]|nr:hypothetical protein [Akkermansiaceae bacterium]